MQPTTWQIIAPWVNRVGMILVFLSFFFAAPEIIGERRLKLAEAQVERLLIFVVKHRTVTLQILPILFGVLAGVVAGPIAEAIRSSFGIPATLLDDGGWLLVFLIIGVVLGAAFGVLIEKLVVRIARLLPILADDSQLRQRALMSGVVIFILGSIMQFAATFV